MQILKSQGTGKVNSQMIITYIADSIIPSQTANSIHVMKMCQAYVQNGHKVYLIIPRRNKKLQTSDVYAIYGIKEKFCILSVPIPPINSSTLYFRFILPIIAKFCKTDVLHTRVIDCALGAAGIFGIDTILEVHENPLEKRYNKLRFLKTVSFRHLQLLVTVSNALKNDLQGVGGNKTIAAPDAYDDTEPFTLLTKQDFYCLMNRPVDTRPVAMYTGSLYEGRGVERILAIAGLMPDVLFCIVGGPEDRISQLSANRQENIVFVGYVAHAQIAAILKNADLVLMPHDKKVLSCGGADIAKYTSPMKMFEYLASGTPIVASRLPVLLEILKDDENALIVDDDVNSWVECIRRILGDKLLSKKISTNAQLCAHEYTWRKRAKRILSCLN